MLRAPLKQSILQDTHMGKLHGAEWLGPMFKCDHDVSSPAFKQTILKSAHMGNTNSASMLCADAREHHHVGGLCSLWLMRKGSTVHVLCAATCTWPVQHRVRGLCLCVVLMPHGWQNPIRAQTAPRRRGRFHTCRLFRLLWRRRGRDQQ